MIEADAIADHGSIEDWPQVPTSPRGLLLVDEPILFYDAKGRPWTGEDVRRYWRRTARMRLRRAFVAHGCRTKDEWAAVADATALAMERSLRDYHGRPQDSAWRRHAEPATTMRADILDALADIEGLPPTQPVPHLTYAWEGAQEGFWQAWQNPYEPTTEAERDAEDDAPTAHAQEEYYARTVRNPAVALFADSLSRPNGEDAPDA